MSKKKYTLTLNERQAEVLVAALDFYSRIGIGQFEELVHVYEGAQMGLGDATSGAKLQAAKRYIEDAKHELTGFPANASHSILNPKVNDTFRVAYDIQKVVRHRLAWDKSPDGGTGVWFDKPDQTSKAEPLATIASEKSA